MPRQLPTQFAPTADLSWRPTRPILAAIGASPMGEPSDPVRRPTSASARPPPTSAAN